MYTVLQKVYHPNFNDNFNSSCLIPIILGTELLLSEYIMNR